jgi:hypothetical protein
VCSTRTIRAPSKLWIAFEPPPLAASYANDGDTVTWSDVKALPPHDGAEDQRQAEVFATPWTRTADASGRELEDRKYRGGRGRATRP